MRRPATLRAGLVIYGLDRPLTGIGRYTLELARALAALDASLELTLLTAGGLGPLAQGDVVRQYPLHGCRLYPGLVTLGNLTIALVARRLGLDVVHDPTGVTPFLFRAGDYQTVVTLHDVFAWSLPGHSAVLDRLVYHYWLPRVLPRAGAVITVSQVSRRDIMQHLNVASEKLRVIPYGVAARFRPFPAQRVRAPLEDRFSLSAPYVLYVGALTRRKNIVRALEAFARIQHQFPQHLIVLAGPRKWKQTPVEETVNRLGMEGRVVLTGPLTDSDLPALYSGADLFVFPSLYEGFGLPPLEAMACGTPVVCSNAGSLPEVVGDAAITVDPYDVEGLAEAMRRVLADRDLAEDLRQRGLARAKLFTWEKAARETMQVYEQVLG